MTLTPHQQQVFDRLKVFLTDPQARVFVLRGYAGTGKTTLAKFLIDWLATEEGKQSKLQPELLASTGRAARILTDKTGRSANTVHGHIYTLDVVEEGKQPSTSQQSQPQVDATTGQLLISFGLKASPPEEQAVLYVIDEASMLSHLPSSGDAITRFGSGSVLDDLFAFVGPKSKIIFIGDPAQLPPVSGRDAFSPALNEDFLKKHYTPHVQSAELTEVLRQSEGHAILELATSIRQRIANNNFHNWEELMNFRAPNIFIPYTQKIMIDRYLQTVADNKWEKGLILTHSNKQAFYLNISIRKQLHEGKYLPFPKVGEVLLVAQNSYYVPLANGDQVILLESEKGGIRQGVKFSKVKVMALHNQLVFETLLLQDFLFTPEANLPSEIQKKLLIDFDQRMRKKNIKRNSPSYMNAMKTDPWLNALRAKFGYAVTCHKAQGGEWPHCFINLSDTLNMLGDQARFRWLYTAVSRAKEKLDIKPVYKGNKPLKRTV